MIEGSIGTHRVCCDGLLQWLGAESGFLCHLGSIICGPWCTPHWYSGPFARQALVSWPKFVVEEHCWGGVASAKVLVRLDAQWLAPVIPKC